MDITCNFYPLKHFWFQNGYVCDVQKTSIVSLDKDLKHIYGKHEKRKNRKDVVSFFAMGQPFVFVPKNLQTNFPYLQCFVIRSCGLEKLSREDLRGLKDIRLINLANNKLTSLPDDLFADMKNLHTINFSDNRIERMSSRILSPIKHALQFISFKNNTKINAMFDKDSKTCNDLAVLMKDIDSNCLPPESPAESVFAEFSKFKVSGEFTDFTIVVRGKEFKIHKMVLAAQSSVFKKIFMDDKEELSKSFNRIQNFSEKTFESFLDYFYTGKVDASANEVEMFELASEFDVPEPRKICETLIMANLDKSNAVEVFNLGHRYSSELLKQKSFKIIKTMFPEIDASFEDKLDEINRFVALKNELDTILKK